MGESTFKLFIYLVTTIMQFYILKQSNFLHKYLWGDQDFPRYWANYPCTQIPNYLDDFYVMKLAYHCKEIVYTLIFHYNRRDLSEFLLHHFVTVFLVLFSYSMNYLPVGAVIMLIHDIPDVMLNCFRISMDCLSFKYYMSAYAGMVLSWLYFRIYFFYYWIIRVIEIEKVEINHPV